MPTCAMPPLHLCHQTSLTLHRPHGGPYENSATGTDHNICFYGFGVGGAAEELKRNASIAKATMLRILPDASWHAARHHPVYADQFSLLAPRLVNQNHRATRGR